MILNHVFDVPSAISFVNQVAWKHRSPQRYLGHTKTQVLLGTFRSSRKIALRFGLYVYRSWTFLCEQMLAFVPP